MKFEIVFMKKYITIFLGCILVLSSISFAYALSEYSLSYDDNGNLIQNENYYYEYNGFNKLERIREFNPAGRILSEYFYDSDGQRIMKIIYEEDGSNETTYYVDNSFVATVNETGMFNEITYYHEGSLIAENESGEMKYYHPDHLGSTTLITNESGDVVEETQYMPFGEAIEGGKEGRYTYTGQEDDKEADLMYYDARYYSPGFRHFTQPDQVFGNIYDPQQLNKYSYVRNNPYKYVDPSGNILDTLLDIGFIGYDIYSIVQDPDNWVNYAALGADIAFAIIPFATGGGATVKGVSKADDVLDGAKMAGQRGKLSKNMQKSMGLSSAQKGFQAHHVFPVQFSDDFAKLGIDINQYGNFVESSAHAKRSTFISAQWSKFFEGTRNIDDAISMANKIESGWGIGKIYSKGTGGLKYGMRGAKAFNDMTNQNGGSASEDYCSSHSSAAC